MSTMSGFNQAIIEEFRSNGGKVGGGFAGRTLLLLHTTGAKTGEERVNPLAYLRDGDRFVVVASKGGAPTHPDWYYNVIANPVVGVEAGVEAGVEQFEARAEIAAEPERTRLFNQMAEAMPGFADYQRNTTRILPVIVLTPMT